MDKQKIYNIKVAQRNALTGNTFCHTVIIMSFVTFSGHLNLLSRLKLNTNKFTKEIATKQNFRSSKVITVDINGETFF